MLYNEEGSFEAPPESFHATCERFTHGVILNGERSNAHLHDSR